MGISRHITYGELQRSVCTIASAMKSMGIRKGDVVTIYMPMIPELAMTMLACTRIGAVHSVVFAGFSADSLRDRVVDCHSHWVFTSDEGRRGGRAIKLKEIVDAVCDYGVLSIFFHLIRLSRGNLRHQALEHVASVRKIVVFKRTGEPVSMKPGRDEWAVDVLARSRPYCAPEWMDSEDPLFILYTSGSTGRNL